MAPFIVQQLGEHSYYFEVCAGSMAVLLCKEPASHEVACDLHGGLTNLAWIVKDEELAPELFDRLQRVLYADDVYQDSKRWLASYEDVYEKLAVGELETTNLDWAFHYFIASWMGRNGTAGMERLSYQIATRWTKGGGSGPLRFKNAVDSIPQWCERLRNVHIMRRDLFEVLPKIEDGPRVAIYADPPYFEDTITNKDKGYLHKFDMAAHEKLAQELQRFKQARVVVSYYYHDRLAELYPGWEMVDCKRQKHLAVQNKRGMGRTEAPEVLLLNGPIYTGGLF